MDKPLENYLSSDELIRHFAKLVAAGGGMTLNVGPAADGQIPLIQQERLLDLGKWLEINGEAIYGTSPYSNFYEMKDVEVGRVDENIDFDWKRNSPDPAIAYDHFTAEWTGTITADYAEKYTLTMETDDAVEVTIDGQKVIEFDPKDEKSSKTGMFHFKAGQPYALRVRFTEDNMEAVAILRWKSKSQADEVIPAKAFGRGLAVRYACQQPNICYTTKGDVLYAIALDYPQDQLVLNIPKPDHKLVITMLGCDKVLPYRFENGQLLIDTRSIQYKDIQSTAAWTFKIE